MIFKSEKMIQNVTKIDNWITLLTGEVLFILFFEKDSLVVVVVAFYIIYLFLD